MPQYLATATLLAQVVKRYVPNVFFDGRKGTYTATIIEGNDVYEFTTNTFKGAVFGALVVRHAKDNWTWSAT